MRDFGWTEKQLYTENTAECIQKIIEEMSLRGQAEKIRERQEKLKSRALIRGTGTRGRS